MQRTLLYITPYFPPASKVGALRPLKFVRHLGDHGYRVIVLADLGGADPTDRALFDAIPAGGFGADVAPSSGGSTVGRGELPSGGGELPSGGAELRPGETSSGAVGTLPSGGGPGAVGTLPSGGGELPSGGSRVEVRFEYSGRAERRARLALEGKSRGGERRSSERRINVPAWLRWSPEYVPLGEHGPEIPAALRAARRIVREARVDVIMVNADPYAAMIVGDRVGTKAGIPVVHDLRDPWSVCDLRRPNRPRLQRAIVDRLERGVVSRAARVILNSETTLAAYRAHYVDIEPNRFTCIRNHGDAALIGSGDAVEPAADAPFTMLFLGNFRRFMHGDAMLEALARLRTRGHGPKAVRLAVTGTVTADARDRAAELGVDDMVEERPFVPYTRIGAAMDAADLLVADIPSPMRIPAKLYDYAMSRRPILALGAPDHAELRQVVGGLDGARFAPSDDPAAVAAAMSAAISDGRRVDVPRESTGLDSATATARLAAVLDAAVDGASTGRR